jgi:hypothetical protein
MIFAHYDVFGTSVFYLAGGLALLLAMVAHAVADRFRHR